MMPADTETIDESAITVRNLSVKNDGRRTSRKWAVQNVTFTAQVGKKTLVYGLPESGKTTLLTALRRAEAPHVVMRVQTQELVLKGSAGAPPRVYAETYNPELKPGTFLVVDDPFDGAVAYLAALDRGMLVFVSISGQACFHRFDKLIYLREGQIAFDGTPKGFFQWVRDGKAPDLEFKLDSTVVETDGKMPGCPGLDE